MTAAAQRLEHSAAFKIETLKQWLIKKLFAIRQAVRIAVLRFVIGGDTVVVFALRSFSLHCLKQILFGVRRLVGAYGWLGLVTAFLFGLEVSKNATERLNKGPIMLKVARPTVPP